MIVKHLSNEGYPIFIDSGQGCKDMNWALESLNVALNDVRLEQFCS